MFLSGSDKFVFIFYIETVPSRCASAVWQRWEFQQQHGRAKAIKTKYLSNFPPALGCISFKERAIFHFSRQCRSSRSVWRVLWFSCDEGPQPHCAYISLHTIQEMNVHVCTHIYRHFCINSKHGPFNIRTHQYTNTHTNNNLYICSGEQTAPSGVPVSLDFILRRSSQLLSCHWVFHTALWFDKSLCDTGINIQIALIWEAVGCKQPGVICGRVILNSLSCKRKRQTTQLKDGFKRTHTHTLCFALLDCV